MTGEVMSQKPKVCRIVSAEKINIYNKSIGKYRELLYFMMEDIEKKEKYYILDEDVKTCLKIQDELLFFSNISGALFLIYPQNSYKMEIVTDMYSKPKKKGFIRAIKRINPIRKMNLVDIEKLGDESVEGRIVFLSPKFIIVSVSSINKFVKLYPKDFYKNRYTNMLEDFQIGSKINLFLAYEDSSPVLRPLNMDSCEDSMRSELVKGNIYQANVLGSFVERKSQKVLFYTELKNGYVLIAKLGKSAKYPIKNQKVFIRITDMENKNIKSEIII